MFWIESSRLILRNIIETDFQSFWTLCCDPEVKKFQDFLWLENQEKVREQLKNIASYNLSIPRSAYNLAIVRKQDREWMGWVGFSQAGDQVLGDFEIGYALLQSYRRNGYMTEALQCIIDYCFQTLGVEKINGACIEENAASMRVMEKAGLCLERIELDINPTTGEGTYARYYGITRARWQLHQKEEPLD